MIKRKPFNYMVVLEPVVLHLLDGEIEDPQSFLTGCKETFSKCEEMAKDKFPLDLIRFIGMPLWMYINMKEKLGQEKAFEIIKAGMLVGGVAIQTMLFDPVQHPRSFKMFIERELTINASGSTKWNELEVIDRTDKRFELTVNKCMFHELTTHLGIPEVTPIICQVDNALFNSYLPDEVHFHRAGQKRRIADGSKDGCHFVWDNISES